MVSSRMFTHVPLLRPISRRVVSRSLPIGHPLAVAFKQGSKNDPAPPPSQFAMLVDDPGAVVKLITELKQSANAAKATGGMTMQRDDPLAKITQLK